MSGKVCECGRPVKWVTTVRGRMMPLDPEPLPDGTVMILANGRARVLDEAERKKYPGPLYRSHFAECELAAKFRRPKIPAVRP